MDLTDINTRKHILYDPIYMKFENWPNLSRHRVEWWPLLGGGCIAAMRGHKGKSQGGGHASHSIWLVSTWIYIFIHQARHYESSTLLFVSYISIKTKKDKREFVLTERPSSPSGCPGWAAICPPLSSAFCISKKRSFPVLSRLGHCNLEVPAAAVHITIFRLPPLF